MSRSAGTRTAPPTSPTTASTGIPKRAGDQAAIIWEADDPSESRRITYRELGAEGRNTFANVLKARGVKRCDRVTLDMPMIPEAAYAMLACAASAPSTPSCSAVSRLMRSPAALLEGSRLDGSTRRGPARPQEGAAQGQCRRRRREGRRGDPRWSSSRTGGAELPMQAGRDVYYDEAAKARPRPNAPARRWAPRTRSIRLEARQAEGAPPTTAGYLVFASMTHHHYVFDYHEGETQLVHALRSPATPISFTGRSPNGATTPDLFEGVPNYPVSMSRVWEVVDKHQVNIFYTAPTAICASDAGWLHARLTQNERALRCSARSASR